MGKPEYPTSGLSRNTETAKFNRRVKEGSSEQWQEEAKELRKATERSKKQALEYKAEMEGRLSGEQSTL